MPGSPSACAGSASNTTRSAAVPSCPPDAMRVLVTGGAGFIRSPLFGFLLRPGGRGLLLDKPPPGPGGEIQHPPRPPRLPVRAARAPPDILRPRRADPDPPLT